VVEHALSPEPDQDSDPETQQAWAEEAEHRYQDYLAGRAEPISSEAAFSRVRASLKSEEMVHLTLAEEDELLKASEQIRRGEFTDGQTLLAELRSLRLD
jgi:hypothetical protein